MRRTDEIIPLEKLISRLKNDLSLSEAYVEKCKKMNISAKIDHPTEKKNQRKRSTLYWLEMLQSIRNESP